LKEVEYLSIKLAQGRGLVSGWDGKGLVSGWKSSVVVRLVLVAEEVNSVQ
jgi:hypothetical protein